MAFLRLRGGKYSLTFKWKGKTHIKALGTDNEAEAKQIKQDAEDQLARIRRGQSARWKGNGKRTLEQRRCDKADRLFEKLVEGTDFQRLDGYHALRHSFISVLVAQGRTWDQIAAFVGHLDQRTTRRYIHFMPRDKRATVESIPFEF